MLYPNDEMIQGKNLRLEQQYFFVSCSLQDMIRLHLRQGRKLETFHEKFAIQLNDTHPSIAVAELMRLLIDEHSMDWDTAWTITTQTLSYTNHTVLPEALERWPLPISPRCYRGISRLSTRSTSAFSRVRSRFPGDQAAARLSIIDEHGERYVRMAHLACVAAHRINGVAALHTQLIEADRCAISTNSGRRSSSTLPTA